jgi:hypothetical protein
MGRSRADRDSPGPQVQPVCRARVSVGAGDMTEHMMQLQVHLIQRRTCGRTSAAVLRGATEMPHSPNE